MDTKSIEKSSFRRLTIDCKNNKPHNRNQIWILEQKIIGDKSFNRTNGGFWIKFLFFQGIFTGIAIATAKKINEENRITAQKFVRDITILTLYCLTAMTAIPCI
ncbi:hypothetical protein DFO77_11990 [Marinilabilia salmonicolor]|jgi:hypothetical protein|uniref:Uncharacterized protein n=1 Tax=Marinilabilia salmonicolor TaxID=989 RepID=A0A368UQQ6_9BACT|nr:hypothetical protein DFO77_11990 [Marinilabilia salmonicolor]